MITSKLDWFTKALEESGIVVGGGSLITKSLGISMETPVSIRFATSPNSSWMYFLTVGFGEKYSSGYESKILASLPNLEFDRLLPDLNVIFYSNNRPGSFRVYFDSMWETVSYLELQKKFMEVDPSFIGEVGQVKQINKSINDIFQYWTRSYLSPYCVVNDIDALVINENRCRIIELKRPVEDISTWKPYKTDLRNYERNQELAEKTNSEIINMAYNLDDDKGRKVQIFTTPTRIERSNKIEYKRAVVGQSEAIDFVLGRKMVRLVNDHSSR